MAGGGDKGSGPLGLHPTRKQRVKTRPIQCCEVCLRTVRFFLSRSAGHVMGQVHLTIPRSGNRSTGWRPFSKSQLAFGQAMAYSGDPPEDGAWSQAQTPGAPPGPAVVQGNRGNEHDPCRANDGGVMSDGRETILGTIILYGGWILAGLPRRRGRMEKQARARRREVILHETT